MIRQAVSGIFANHSKSVSYSYVWTNILISGGETMMSKLQTSLITGCSLGPNRFPSSSSLLRHPAA